MLTLFLLAGSLAAQDTPPAAPAEPTAEGARQRLQQSWESLLQPADKATPAPQLVATAPLPEALLSLPQQKSPAAAATTTFQEPEEIRSVNGTLRVTLVVTQAYNRIGADPVFLRSYNGHLVGPTLRAKPGDTLRITLKNDLPVPDDDGGEHNTLHDFNVTNLHTHGLHVSPSGISDNVLLVVKPTKTQEYEIIIPRDHPAGTFWYHAHHHGSTAAQVASGMSGALIIDGDMDHVPEIARARERLFVLQQIAYLYKNCFNDKQPDGSFKRECYDLPFGVIEEKYQDRIFGPGTWEKLGRYTTINGVQLPVIRLRPGSVERWRFIDSGMRERIELKLESTTARPGQPAATLPLHVIAEDGLALGKVDRRETVELWPGYRADVLVQAPDQPGEYLLLDEETAAKVSLDGLAENRKYLARVIVEGAPQPMSLPVDAQLARYRLPSIPASAVTGPPQTASYGILRKPGGGVLFTINGKAFDESNVRQLTLGKVDEWILTSVNAVGAVSHPYHIHVNPFEIYSMVDDKGVEQLKYPIWRDTIILHEKWIVKARTHYTDYAGKFVQHCHILDHEDQGMMEYVEIVDPKNPAPAPAPLVLPSAPVPPYPAPAFSLPDSTGKIWTQADFLGKPTVLFFFKGHGCVHCVQQVSLFAKQAQAFAEKGIQLVGVSTDTVDELRTALADRPSPYPLLSDPELVSFRQYHCVGSETFHGTFLLDAAGQVRWQTIGLEPFTGLGLLFQEAAKLTSPAPTAAASLAAPRAFAATSANPAVEIQIRDTATGDDDYIAWEPTNARIRQNPAAAPAGDLTVVLTNDPAQPVPAGRDQPLDGDVVFAATAAPGAALTRTSLALTLPKTGAWVPFLVAGKFPQASTQDKDALIEIHRTTSDGPILQTHPLMVRIRKDHRKLTTRERLRFLEALDYLNRKALGPDGQSRYMYFVRLHQAAAVGLAFGERSDINYYWPDLAHKGPGFIAWHRAFLLEFEREIQKTFPDVALPYWVMPEPSLLFSTDFMGANDVLTTPTPTPMAARFAPDNPLYGWTADIDGDRNQPVQRFAVIRIPGPGTPSFTPDATLFKLTSYSRYPNRGGFVDAMESNPHNIGHNWVGPWMQNCQTSPRDPIFWVFHAGFDRQWAHWQYLYGRFDPTGARDSYFPLGSFANPQPKPTPGDCDDITSPNTCVPITHRIADNLWPWSQKFGQAPTKKGSLPQASFAQPVLHPFPAAPAPGLWPQADAHPTPGDMIDYLGVTPGRLPMGFGYDDTPYGIAPPSAAPPLLKTASTESLKTITNRQLSAPQRLAAIDQLDPATPPDSTPLLTIARAKDEDATVRSGALRAAQQLDDPRWIDDAFVILTDREHSDIPLTVDTIRLLTESMMLSARGNARKTEIVAALNAALADPREPVRLAALWSLVGMDHASTAVAELTLALQSPDGAAFKPEDAIRGLALANQALLNAPLIRPYLTHADPALRAIAITSLGDDLESRPALRQLLADRGQPLEVRLAVLRTLGGQDSATLTLALDLATNPAEPLELRAEAIATLGLAARSAQKPLSLETLQTINQRLGRLSATDLGRLGPVVARTVFDATRQLNQLPAK